jgi:hypothetical protein
MKLRRPSPALVVSIIALVVACAGSATAATLIGSSQVRNNSLTSNDVKNRSLRGTDLRNGTLTATQLSKATLKKLGGGAATGSTAYEAFRKAGPENQPANVVVKVATLSVPVAGSYVIQAKTVMTAFTGSTNGLEGLFNTASSLGGHCQLDAAGDVDDSSAPIVIQNRPSPSTLYMQVTRSFGGAAAIDLKCDAQASWRTSDTSIIAHKVDSAPRNAVG